MPALSQSTDLLPALLPHVIANAPSDMWVAFVSSHRCTAIARIPNAVGSGLPQLLRMEGMRHPLWRSLAQEAWGHGAEALAFGRTDGPGASAPSERDRDYEVAYRDATRMMGLYFVNYWVLSKVASDSVRVLYTSRRQHDDADAEPYLLQLPPQSKAP